MTEIRVVDGCGVTHWIKLHREPRVARTSGGKVILSWGYAGDASVELTMDEGMLARIVGREPGECECAWELDKRDEEIEELKESLAERSEPLILFA